MEVERYKMIFHNPNNIENKTKEIIYKVQIENENDNKKIIKGEMEKEKKEAKLKILGHQFVKNNKNKCKLIIYNKKYSLNEFFIIKENKYDNIKIGLILIKDLCNRSFIFENCKSLKSFFNYNDIQIQNIDEKELEGNNVCEGDDTFLLYDDKNGNAHPIYKNSRDYEINYSTIKENEEIIDNQGKSLILFWKSKLNISQNYCINLEKMSYNCE